MKDWKFRDLFGGGFRKGLKERFGHPIFKVIRILLLLMLLGLFFSVGVVPTNSMYPNVIPKDYVLFQKHVAYQRGDIVTFNYPLDERIKFIKRIIGLPGEEVEVRNDLVYINGKPLKEPYLIGQTLYVYPKTKIPLNKYFVLGDNRNNSDDSHIWGFVKEDEMRGKAIAILLPINRFKVFKSPY